MKKLFKSSLVGIILFALLSSALFVFAGVPEAVTYLQAQPQDPWITQALAAGNAANISTSHLTSVSGTLATDYAKTILAIAALGENPATFGAIDYIAKLKTYHANNQMGDATLLNDDMWSILALAAAGEVNSTQAADAKNFLITHQNTDGGWGYITGGESDTNDTAAAIMALVEAGVSASDPVITHAVSYLQNAQNDDGGFGWMADSSSDSGSDSWVIAALNKIGIDASEWEQNGNSPITYLESLQDADGGFWWVAPGAPSNDKGMTAFAVIALLGETFPVGYFTGTPEGTHHLRIEGQNETICDADVEGTTALDIVENGAQVCGYTYVIMETSFGPYLSQINNEAAQGLSGWMYFVNFISPPSGAGDYILEEGDEVLWYYGEWGWPPTRVSVDTAEIDPGQAVNVTVQYFDGASWLALPNAIIKVNSEQRSVNENGLLTLTIYENGVYQIYVETAGYVRSEKTTVAVGDTVNQSVSLQVEIEQSGGQIAGEAIAFTIDADEIDFGALAPGESAAETVNLTNEGTVLLDLGASVSGDAVFVSGIKINNEHYNDYSDSLIPAETKSAAVSLTVPTSYLASGVRNGELIFWATAE